MKPVAVEMNRGEVRPLGRIIVAGLQRADGVLCAQAFGRHHDPAAKGVSSVSPRVSALAVVVARPNKAARSMLIWRWALLSIRASANPSGGSTFTETSASSTRRMESSKKLFSSFQAPPPKTLFPSALYIFHHVIF